MRIFDLIRGRSAPTDPELQARFDAFARAAQRSDWQRTIADLPESEPLLEGSPREQMETILMCLERIARHLTGRRTFSTGDFSLQGKLSALASRLLQRKLEHTDADFVTMLGLAARHFHASPHRGVVRAIEKKLDGEAARGKLRAALEQFRRALEADRGAETRKLIPRIDELLSGRTAERQIDIECVDAWTVALHAALEEAGARQAFGPLLAHCAVATSPKPSKRWLVEAGTLIEGVGVEQHGRLLEAVLTAVGTKAPFPVQVAMSWGPTPWADGDATLVSDRYADLLRGVIWSSVAGDLDAHIAIIGDTAERCFKKLSGHGPLAPKIGNACLFALSQASSLDGVGQLSRLETRVKHASVRRQLGKALDAAAERAGLSVADLEDIAVPTCGLTAIGRRTTQIGTFTAELLLTGSGTTQVTWTAESGKTQKSVPAAVKTDHQDDLAALKVVQKEIKKSFPAHRQRIERMLLSQRTLPYAGWRKRYWDHPFVGYIARRLIWWFGDGESAELACADGGRLVDREGREMAPSKETPVRLWHPIESSAETVRAWREWLGTHEIVQPFKQAHREIYLLTDAERGTETYSNRFAAHVIKQHQFNALCQERGWHYTLQGQWDSHNTPFLDLPDFGLRVEFWADSAAGLEQETSDAGVFLYLATDQVRFLRMREDGPVRLEEIPPIVLTEVMRDVDLFVGVCSAGNDPNWQDGGPGGRYGAYWTEYAFGDLSETAKTRHAALASLVPKLKIADVCELGERFLTVRGKLRSYHIHLGSANIRMSPNDEYLCIVPSRRAGSSAAKVLLPFEGDSVLSIILSKAFLLADDDTIKDPAIVNQIRVR